MPRRANAKREHEYQELVEEFKEEHRYEGREEEVAARIVNKQRAEHGETQAAQEEKAHGQDDARNLPRDNYDSLTVDQITARLGDLDKKQLRVLRNFEAYHNNRKTMMEALDRHLNDA